MDAQLVKTLEKTKIIDIKPAIIEQQKMLLNYYSLQKQQKVLQHSKRL